MILSHVMFAVNRKVVKNCLFIRLAMFIYLTYHISVQYCIRPLYFANESQMIKQVSLKTEQNVDLKHTCKLKLFNGTFYTHTAQFCQTSKAKFTYYTKYKTCGHINKNISKYVCLCCVFK